MNKEEAFDLIHKIILDSDASSALEYLFTYNKIQNIMIEYLESEIGSIK